MGKRGPKPRAVQIGTVSKIPFSEPRAIVFDSQPPAHLDQVAKDQWQRVTRTLDDMGILSDSDSQAVELYCVLYSRWRMAEDKIRTEGYIKFTDKGFPMQSDWVGISNSCIDKMTKLLASFGMTPADRARVNARGKEKTTGEDKWAAFKVE